MANYRKHASVGYREPPEGEMHATVWRRINDFPPVEPDDTLAKFDNGIDKPVTEADVAQAWQQHGDSIIERFAREMPGTRPSMWWAAQTEMRERVGGVGVVCEGYGTHLGAPRVFEGEDFDWNDTPLFESQATYLRRTNQLLRGELSRLTDADFEPERVPISMPERQSFCPVCAKYISVLPFFQNYMCRHCGARLSGLGPRIDME